MPAIQPNYWQIWGDKLPIEPEKMQKFLEDSKRGDIIIRDIKLDIMLKAILMFNLSRFDKEVEKLLDLLNIAQKARLAYALKIINKTTLNDTIRMHDIRNRFAHHLKMNFTDTEIIKKCKKLSTAVKGESVSASKAEKFYMNAQEKCWDCFTDKIREYHQILTKKMSQQSKP